MALKAAMAAVPPPTMRYWAWLGTSGRNFSSSNFIASVSVSVGCDGSSVWTLSVCCSCWGSAEDVSSCVTSGADSSTGAWIDSSDSCSGSGSGSTTFWTLVWVSFFGVDCFFSGLKK